MNISFEFFPARTEHRKKDLNEVQKELSAIKPEFFSVTFGALGSSQDATFETIVNLLKNTNVPISPHLTCVGIKKSQAIDLLDKYIELGVNRVMVLKGDTPTVRFPYKNSRDKGDFHFANEMVKFIKEQYKGYFHIQVGAFPEKHPQSKSFTNDIKFFVNKVNSGADSAVTQYFYNVDAYFSFVDEVQKCGVDIPIVPGIMPITNYENLMSFSKIAGAKIPSWIINRLKIYKDDKESLKAFGQEVVSEMCLKLKAGGVKDFHFYSMNRIEPVLSIAQNIKA
jgi:methylenetetrahydrofolate reductase (NADPH)